MNRKAIEERKRNRWQIDNDHREIARTIRELYSGCIGVELHIKLSFTSAFGKNEQDFDLVMKPDDRAHWYHECLNRDCTGFGFSLDNEIYSAIQSKQIKEGTIRCDGKEDWKYIDNSGCSCMSECQYRIVPLF